MSQHRHLQRLLAPRSVAIVGASADPRSLGDLVLGNLERFGYSGQIHLVSRSSETLGGRPCVKTVDELPEEIDVAVLAIAQTGMPDAVAALAARRCHAAVLFASGYAEVGEEGRQRQDLLVQAAGAMHLVGPNCMGFTNFEAGVPLTYEPLTPYPCSGRAGVAVLAQSGFIAAHLRDAFIGRGLPITAAFSTGNEASVGGDDVLAHLLDDVQTRVVCMVAEQIRDPQAFLALARAARHACKPIVLLLPGRSGRALAAAQAHAGTPPSDDDVAVAQLEGEAVVVVDTLDELIDTSAILFRHARPNSGGTAVITGSGAMKNIALDLAGAIGLPLPALEEATVQALKLKLPSFAIAENPLDYTTIDVRQPGLVGEIVDCVAADANIGSVLLAIPAGTPVAQRDKAEHFIPALAALAKPKVLVITGDDGPIEPFFVDAIRAAGVPLFRSVDRALRALRCTTRYGENSQRAERTEHAALAGRARAGRNVASEPAVPAPQAMPGAVPANGVFPEHLSKQFLAAAGVPVPEGGLAQDAEAAAAIARRLGKAVVLKAQASDLPHKREVGGVIAGLAGKTAVLAGWNQLTSNLGQHRPGLLLDGVLVEAMAPSGVELTVGARRDPAWGAVLRIGIGGVWTEALNDLRWLPAGAVEADIADALRGLKCAALLQGVRGTPAVNLAAVARVAATVAALLRADARIAEIEINPLLAHVGGVLALDASLVVAVPEAPG
jgi:acetate---CoA ligase (ADP-forming)